MSDDVFDAHRFSENDLEVEGRTMLRFLVSIIILPVVPKILEIIRRIRRTLRVRARVLNKKGVEVPYRW